MNKGANKAFDVEQLSRELKGVAKELEAAKQEGARLDVSSAQAVEQVDEAIKLLEAMY